MFTVLLFQLFCMLQTSQNELLGFKKKKSGVEVSSVWEEPVRKDNWDYKTERKTEVKAFQGGQEDSPRKPLANDTRQESLCESGLKPRNSGLIL